MDAADEYDGRAKDEDGEDDEYLRSDEMKHTPEMRNGKAYCSYNCPAIGIDPHECSPRDTVTCLEVYGYFIKTSKSLCRAVDRDKRKAQA